MPLSEYVRRRRMTVAAADVVRGEDDLLSIAVRHGYGSTEAFGRAFRAVHGTGPGDVRRDGGPLRAQPQLRFRLTEPGGLLQVCDDLDPDSTEGSEFTYLHGVAVCRDTPAADGLDTIEVPAGRWAVFRTAGPHPKALQKTWAATATEWFPSNPWRLRPGPSIVAVVERADDFSTATCELWLPVEPT
jgi:AraC family transcriptional regulator